MRRATSSEFVTVPVCAKRRSSTRSVPHARTVFVSYSHRDVTYLDRVITHLSQFEKQGLIELWADTKLRVGSQWRNELRSAIDRAGVAILLISADFLASDFIIDNELPPLLHRARSKGVLIMPVIVGYCSFERNAALAQFQAVNDPSRPLKTLPTAERDKIFDKLAREVVRAIGV